MTGDTVHEIDEFGDFPWHKLDSAWFKSCGGYSRGGVVAGVDFNRPFSRPQISFVASDGTADVWEIPVELMLLLDAKHSQGMQDARRKIRAELGIR